MGTICILLGLILLVLATFGGFLLAHVVVSNELYMTLLGLGSAPMVYGVAVGACFLIGLLICLNLVMNGMIYNTVRKDHAMLKNLMRHHRHHHHRDEDDE